MLKLRYNNYLKSLHGSQSCHGEGAYATQWAMLCSALQIAEERREAKGKGERERYTQMSAEFR